MTGSMNVPQLVIDHCDYVAQLDEHTLALVRNYQKTGDVNDLIQANNLTDKKVTALKLLMEKINIG